MNIRERVQTLDKLDKDIGHQYLYRVGYRTQYLKAYLFQLMLLVQSLTLNRNLPLFIFLYILAAALPCSPWLQVKGRGSWGRDG